MQFSPLIPAEYISHRICRPCLFTRHPDFLDLRPQLLQCSVAIDAVGDVISEAVAQHALAVCLPDAVAFTEPAEGVAAGVRRSLWKPNFRSALFISRRNCEMLLPPKYTEPSSCIAPFAIEIIILNSSYIPCKILMSSRTATPSSSQNTMCSEKGFPSIASNV